MFQQSIVGICSENDFYISNTSFQELDATYGGKLVAFHYGNYSAKCLNEFENRLGQMLELSSSWKRFLLPFSKLKQESFYTKQGEMLLNYKMSLKEYLEKYYGLGFYFKRLIKFPEELLEFLLKMAKNDQKVFKALYYSVVQYYSEHRKCPEDTETFTTNYYERQFGRSITLIETVYISYYNDLPFSKFIVKANSFNQFLKQSSPYIHPADKFSTWLLPDTANFKLKEKEKLFRDSKHYKFRLIRNENELTKEGETMKHCAGNFSGEVTNRQALFYHITSKNSKDVLHKKGFTLKIMVDEGLLKFGELRAFANNKAPLSLEDEIKKQLKKSMNEGYDFYFQLYPKSKTDYIKDTINYYQNNFKSKMTKEEVQIIKQLMLDHKFLYDREAKCYSELIDTFKIEYPEVDVFDL